MSVSFDRAAELYDRTRSFPQETMKKAVRILEDELRNCKLVLDVGVGTGRFAEPLLNLGSEVVGVDISRKMMQKAIDKKLKNVVFADVCHLPFFDSASDVSLSVHVLHLTEKWRVALAEIARVTKHALYSILKENPTDGPRDLYKKLMKKYGYDCRHPGIGEWDLKNVVKPSKSICVDTYEGNVDSALASLREKAFSHQWNAPEEVHQKAMSELARIVSGITYVNKVYLHKWDITEIKKHIR